MWLTIWLNKKKLILIIFNNIINEIMLYNLFTSSIWPGADLSPIEFGGKWKLAAYQVEPMYRPLIVTASEVEGSVDIHVVSDLRQKRPGLRVRLSVHRYVDAAACSNVTFASTSSFEAEPTSSSLVMRLPVAQILDRCKFREFDHLEAVMAEREKKVEAEMADEEAPPEEEDASMSVRGDHRRYAAFLVVELLDADTGAVLSEAHLLLCEPKHAAGLSDPELRASVHRVTAAGEGKFEIRFRAKRVALFVYLVSHFLFFFHSYSILGERKKCFFTCYNC